MRGFTAWIALSPCLASLLAGCATTQTIPIGAQPQPIDVYVDGKLMPETDQIELAPDRNHTLYFKKPGYHSELVVLESRGRRDAAQLEPGTVQVQLRPRAE